jgi:hypothetical protein
VTHRGSLQLEKYVCHTGGIFVTFGEQTAGRPQRRLPFLQFWPAIHNQLLVRFCNSNERQRRDNSNRCPASASCAAARADPCQLDKTALSASLSAAVRSNSLKPLARTMTSIKDAIKNWEAKEAKKAADAGLPEPPKAADAERVMLCVKIFLHSTHACDTHLLTGTASCRPFRRWTTPWAL